MLDVVFVCTGNLVRSPMAEALLRREAEGLPVAVRSAGVLDLRGAPSPREAVDALAAHGLDLSAHRSRCLAGADLSEADLVIGFDTDHTAAAVVEAGARPEVTFSLREFLRLTEEMPEPGESGVEDRARTVIAAAHEPRDGAAFVAGEGIDDPYGGPAAGYERAAAEIVALVEALALRLFGMENVTQSARS